ncbi:peptidoglycan-binding protein [Streptomyces sp. NBC_00663]|uniref:peptidoglycan-binding protein n=1 Tax=Streptomyces sp. NBC_00663 TaxID=2975801 RepID=UPI002E3160F6|nr:peptidoglycan-binding protein [Streptomyces sp. NBC_00663]
MSEQAGPVCPECGTARAADGTPDCACARRASDAHRAERSEEAAAAEDFDPVRIRPFVEVGTHTASLDPPVDATEDEDDPTAEPADGARELREPHSAPDAPVLTPPYDSAPYHPAPDGTARQRRRRRALLTAGWGGATAAVLTGCVVGGLYWYDGPDRDASPSGGVRASLPEPQPSADRPSPSAGSPTRSPTRPPASTGGSTDAFATPSPATPTDTPTATRTASGAAPTATGGGPTPSSSGSQAPVLRLGDQGPEVVELQLRLRQVGFYGGDADGTYDSQVESAVRGYQVTRVVQEDEPGVYGPRTRAVLESETSEP